jgi:sterol desaturase/sphingolipid hydroxylase (fatty acid hydroxylase superfamily)
MEVLNNLLQTFQPYALTGVFLLTYIAEHILPQRKEIIDHKHDLKNIAIGVLNLVLIAVVGMQFQRAIEWFNEKHFGFLQVINLPSIMAVLIGVLLIDIFMYWWHRINHEWSFLWYFHRFHHIDTKLNSTTALRFHTGELMLSYVLKIIVFSLLGISLSAILVHSILFFPIVVFHHSNLRISEQWDLFLRRLIVTPRMHRIHHSVIKSETNSNYSSISPYWDKLFKTYIKHPSKEIEFGVLN